MGLSILFVFGTLISTALATNLPKEKWRTATEKELTALLPLRAPVEKEQIETELRTAAGVINGKGQLIAGVVIITAGYAADGKYSHFLVVQTPIRIEEIAVPTGEYVFGYRRVDEDSLEVRFYEAATGKQLGTVRAVRLPAAGPIRSLQIAPPEGDTGTIQLGRFALKYTVSAK